MVEVGKPADMVLAIPSKGNEGLESERSEHFGRCDSFALAEIKNGEVACVRVVPNPPHSHGGCMRPVELLMANGATALVVAGMGARPFVGLKAAGIDVYYDAESVTVGEAVNAVSAGTAPLMEDGAVCSGH